MRFENVRLEGFFPRTAESDFTGGNSDEQTGDSDENAPTFQTMTFWDDDGDGDALEMRGKVSFSAGWRKGVRGCFDLERCRVCVWALARNARKHVHQPDSSRPRRVSNRGRTFAYLGRAKEKASRVIVGAWGGWRAFGLSENSSDSSGLIPIAPREEVLPPRHVFTTRNRALSPPQKRRQRRARGGLSD